MIDVGANVEEFAKQFIGSGSSIKYFEPNPYCIPKMETIALRHNVKVIRAAACTYDGLSDLFLHEDHDLDPGFGRLDHLMVKGKRDVNTNNSICVKAFDLSRYIFELNMPVRVLTIDIERLEVRLLPYLFQTG